MRNDPPIFKCYFEEYLLKTICRLPDTLSPAFHPRLVRHEHDFAVLQHQP